MKPVEYIDNTMCEAIARMPSTPEERDAYKKGMIARMADIEQKLKIHADNPAHVKQLKDEWNRLNGLFLASFDRSEPKQENEALKYTKEYILKNCGKDFTCGCGLYVHPDHRLTNPNAIHIKGCMFDPKKTNKKLIK
jgi:hypothetical protein